MHPADEISLVPPQVVADNAARGLAFREKFGRGGTEIGVGRARELVARRTLQPSVIRRMVSYFARHEVDKRAKNFGNDDNPSPGYVAWLLWGGDEGRAWALELKSRIGNAPDI
jgi:hypothetical protein